MNLQTSGEKSKKGGRGEGGRGRDGASNTELLQCDRHKLFTSRQEKKKTDEKMSEVQAGDEWRLPTIGSCLLFFCFGPSVHVQNRPKDSHLVFLIVGFGLKGSKLPQ